MTKRNLPQPLLIDKIHFRNCFTAPSLRHFAALMTGWTLTVGIHTINQVILIAGLHESEYFSNIYKFIRTGKGGPDRIAFEIFRVVIGSMLPDYAEIEFVIDDTLDPCVGKYILGTEFQHDGNASKTDKPVGYGVCFVVIGVAINLPGISDRVFCLPYAACGGRQRPRSDATGPFTRPSPNSPQN
ncbi:MAG: hypothetical protein ACLQT6_03155 [Desulfomonilaceae bacterium]